MARFRKINRQQAVEKYDYALRTGEAKVGLYAFDRDEQVFREGALRQFKMPPMADPKAWAGARYNIEESPKFEPWSKTQLEEWGISSADFYVFSHKQYRED